MMKTHSKSIFHNFTPLILIAMILGTLPASPVQAESLARPLNIGITYTVNSTLDQPDDLTIPGTCHTVANTCTLRAAIMQANRSSGAGATIIVPAGLYKLTIPATGADGEENGDLNLTTPVSGTPAIAIIGDGSATTIIDANQLDRVLYVDSNRTASISGVTIRNGYSPTQSGGGISNSGNLTLTNSTVSGNTSSNGSIFNFGILVVTNSTISGNSSGNGGAIFNFKTLTVTNSTLSGNSATQDGGGIYNANAETGDTLILTNSILSGNSADRGGGIFIQDGMLSVTNSTLSGNSATLDGGGIYNTDKLTITGSTLSGNSASKGGSIYNNNALTITNSTLSGNIAYVGGGIYNGTTLFLINSTISHNKANSDGGGIFNEGTANVYNATIAFNGADYDANASGVGGGVFNVAGKTFNLINTLIAGNVLSNSPSPNDCAGTLSSSGGNLFLAVMYDNGICTITNNNGSWAYLNSIFRIGPLQDNGGPTWTHALLPGSNAIDGGEPILGCVDSSYNQLPTDQRGFARPAGAWCDVGAYERTDYTPPTVSSIVRINSDPTALTSVGFTVTFSESVTGVNASDFTLTTTGVSSAAVSGVSGSGSIYTVTVSTGTGNGTIRLDLLNDGTILDVVLNPLGAGFTSGETYTIIRVFKLFLPLILR